jgi:hypothetical protein
MIIFRAFPPVNLPVVLKMKNSMTTINHPERQTSLFTMNGLADPRLMQKENAKPVNPNAFRRMVREAFSITAFIESLALKRTIFRFRD